MLPLQIQGEVQLHLCEKHRPLSNKFAGMLMGILMTLHRNQALCTILGLLIEFHYSVDNVVTFKNMWF